jgi:outer membrane immunogenic protein
LQFHKTILIAAASGAATAALALPGFAADLPSYQAEPPANIYADAGMDLATGDWTGFYAGVHAGGITTDELDDDFDAENIDWSGGVQAGYLHQIDIFVIGAEVEASIANELTYVLAPDAGVQENWSVLAKGRAGVNLGDTLLYGTAGLTMAGFEGTGNAVLDEKVSAGVAFGAGVEHRVTDTISLRAEYLQTRYLDLGSSVAGMGRTDDLTNHAVNVGLNFHF